MDIKRARAVVLVIFLATLVLRLGVTFQTPHFTGDEAYFTLRQVDHITETGLPLFDDELSYGGRYLVFPILYYYVLALFNLFLPITLVAKIFPNLFASLLVPIMFMIAMRLTKNIGAALFTASLSAFIPIFVASTINTISPYSLVIPFVFYMLFCFMNLSEKKYVYRLVLMTFLLPLLHASGIILAIGLLIYLLFVKLENLKLRKVENELILFMLFVIIWLEFIIFKKALLFHGPSVIWQNIPGQLLGLGSLNVFVLDVLHKVGYIPLVYGIYAIYKYVFNKKDREIYLLIGFASASFLMIVLRLIRLEYGLLFFASVMVLLFSQAYVDYTDYVSQMRFNRFKALLIFAFYVTFLLTSFVPSVTLAFASLESAPSQAKIDALTWLGENTDPSSVVLGDVSEGHLINSVAGRKNVLDSHFLMVPDAEERLVDSERILNTKLETDAIHLMDKYDVDYIILSEETREKYGLHDLSYGGDERCFDKKYADVVLIYSRTCSLEER